MGCDFDFLGQAWFWSKTTFKLDFYAIGTNIKCRNQWKIEKLSFSGNLFCIFPIKHFYQPSETIDFNARFPRKQPITWHINLWPSQTSENESCFIPFLLFSVQDTKNCINRPISLAKKQWIIWNLENHIIDNKLFKILL